MILADFNTANANANELLFMDKKPVDRLRSTTLAIANANFNFKFTYFASANVVSLPRSCSKIWACNFHIVPHFCINTFMVHIVDV